MYKKNFSTISYFRPARNVLSSRCYFALATPDPEGTVSENKRLELPFPSTHRSVRERLDASIQNDIFPHRVVRQLKALFCISLDERSKEKASLASGSKFKDDEC